MLKVRMEKTYGIKVNPIGSTELEFTTIALLSESHPGKITIQSTRVKKRGKEYTYSYPILRLDKELLNKFVDKLKKIDKNIENELDVDIHIVLVTKDDKIVPALLVIPRE